MIRSNKVQYSSEKNMLLGSNIYNRGQDSLIIMQKVSKNNLDHP